ncbi:hypothetical protein SALBM135S_05570 [Streptomyces alboniger]
MRHQWTAFADRFRCALLAILRNRLSLFLVYAFVPPGRPGPGGGYAARRACTRDQRVRAAPGPQVARQDAGQ